MSKTTPTHKRDSVSKDVNHFSPISIHQSPALFSSQKNLTGTPRIIRDLCADLYNNIQKWNDLHITGAQIIKQIASCKAEDPKNSGLETFINDLYEVVQNLMKYRNCFDIFTKQISALEKLNINGPIFISMDLKSISQLISDIKDAYKQEFNVKQQILENIMYTKSKNNLMFLASCWTYQCYITNDINFKLECLLIETGHRKIN